MVIAAGAAGGPNWTDIMTAFGTVGAVITAVGIALVTGLLSGRQLRKEQVRSDRLLAEQREQEKAAIAEERAYGKAQLEEERKIAREREQLAQAYAVQVALSQYPGERENQAGRGDGPPRVTFRLAATIVNHGSYTINRVEAQFCLGNSMISPHRHERVAGSAGPSESPLLGGAPSPERTLRGVLTPFDEFIRFDSDYIPERDLAGWYAVVRWTDHWGTRWEHKRGMVRQVRDDQEWKL